MNDNEKVKLFDEIETKLGCPIEILIKALNKDIWVTTKEVGKYKKFYGRTVVSLQKYDNYYILHSNYVELFDDKGHYITEEDEIYPLKSYGKLWWIENPKKQTKND